MKRILRLTQTIARQYTQDAWVIMDQARGRDEIEKSYERYLGGGGKQGKLETVEVQEMGDWAYEIGNFTVTQGLKTVYRSTYLCVWKKENGQWKIHRDIASPVTSPDGQKSGLADAGTFAGVFPKR